MIITSYFGLKPCCDCGRTGNYTVNKNGYQFTVCSDCIHNYSDEEEKGRKMTKEEIITNLVKFNGNYEDDEEYQRKIELYDEIWEEAEKFLKEISE